MTINICQIKSQVLTLYADDIDRMISDEIEFPSLEEILAYKLKRALIVHDRSSEKESLSEVMDLFDIPIDVASGGRDGFRKASRNDYSLLIVDLHMQEEESLDFLGSIEILDIHTPVVLITGTRQDQVDQALKAELNVVGCLSKPIEPEDLKPFIDRCYGDSQDQVFDNMN